MKTIPRRVAAAVSAFCAALLLAACSSTGPVSRENVPSSAPAGGGMPRTAPAESSRYASEDRPGLGTGWGEWRESSTSQTHFARQNSTSPQSLLRLYYNDRDGIDAMLRHIGGIPRKAAPPMRLPGSLVSAWLRDGSGRWLDGWLLRGDGFVSGTTGGRYEIYVRNESRARVEVVLSVDGLDVMDGRSASFKKRGYVLNPGESVVVDGFRTGANSVAAFRFSSVSSSYAALKHGNTRNVGVIGIAAFPERGSDPWSNEPYRREAADPFPSRKWATGPQ